MLLLLGFLWTGGVGFFFLLGVVFSFPNLANELAKTLTIAFQHIPLDRSLVSYTAPTTSTDHFYHSVNTQIFLIFILGYAEQEIQPALFMVKKKQMNK